MSTSLDVADLPGQGFGPAETHGQEGEAVPGQVEGWALFALGVEVFDGRKIAGVKIFRQASNEISDSLQNIVVPFAKMFG